MILYSMNGRIKDQKIGGKIRTFFLRFVLPFIVILLLWQTVAEVVNKEFLVPYPATVFIRLSELVFYSDYWLSIGATLLRVFFGFVLGIFAGILTAAAMYVSKIAEYLLLPVMNILKTTPVVSFILIVLLWVDSSWLPSIISAIMVIPVVWANTFSGLKGIKREYLEMAKMYRLPFSVCLKSIYIPSLKAPLVAASVAGVGLAWKSGVTAEVLALPVQAIGLNLYNAKIYLESPDIFAWTITIIVVGRFFESAVFVVGRRILGGELYDRTEGSF